MKEHSSSYFKRFSKLLFLTDACFRMKIESEIGIKNNRSAVNLRENEARVSYAECSEIRKSHQINKVAIGNLFGFPSKICCYIKASEESFFLHEPALLEGNSADYIMHVSARSSHSTDVNIQSGSDTSKSVAPMTNSSAFKISLQKKYGSKMRTRRQKGRNRKRRPVIFRESS